MKKTAKEIEEIKEVAKKTLEWYCGNNSEETGSRSCGNLKLDNFIKHLGIEPSISEGMFVTNEFGCIVYARKIDGSLIYGYGINLNGNYEQDNERIWYLTNPREATKQEVEEAFTKLARKMGYVKGVTFKSAYSGDEYTAENDVISFDHDPDDFYILLNRMAIFNNGKWAEIIEQESEISKAYKALGKALGV